MSEQAIMAAAKMYEMRETARFLLGDRYKELMDIWGTMITMRAMWNKRGILEEVTDMAGKLPEGGDPQAIIVMMAAAVELMEPNQ